MEGHLKTAVIRYKKREEVAPFLQVSAPFTAAGFLLANGLLKGRKTNKQSPEGFAKKPAKKSACFMLCLGDVDAWHYIPTALLIVMIIQ